MKYLVLGVLLFTAGCLDYEVEVRTVVTKDGSSQRSVRIKERSDKHETWRRYGPPQAPYAITGDDANGFEARASFAPGRHAGGVRCLHESPDGEYKGAAQAEGLPGSEGTFSIGTDDLEIGTLYRYREEIDIGIDLAAFRAGVEPVVRYGSDFLVAALELAEPDLDFRPVRDNARRTLVPDVTRVLLSIHSQLRIMELRGAPLSSLRTIDDLTGKPEVAVILAELDRIGIRRRPGAPEAHDIEQYFALDAWTIREGLWARLLAPLDGVDEALREKLWTALMTDDGQEGKSEAEERAGKIWEQARANAFPKEKSEAVEASVRQVFAAGLGYPFTNNMFDRHFIDVSLRLPGRVLSTNGVLQADGDVTWRIRTGGGFLSNPVLVAHSFVPSEAMVGRIVSVEKLLEFGRKLEEPKEGEREGLKRFLANAREAGIDAASRKAGSNSLVSALAEALAPAR